MNRIYNLLDVRHTYFLFLFLFDFGLAWCSTTIIPGLKRLGISVGEIGLMEAVFWGFIMATEIPSGLYADRTSRVRTLALSSAVLTVGGAVYMSAVGLKTAILGELLLGVGMAIGSNALRSWIAHAIEDEESDPIIREQALTKLFGTSQMLRSIVALVSGTLGGLAPNPPQWGIWLPFTICNGLSLVLVLTAMRKHDFVPKRKNTPAKEMLREGATHILTHKTLLWAIAAATVMGMLVPYYNYWTLYFRESVGEENMYLMWICAFIPNVAGGLIVWRFGHGKMSEAGAITLSIACTGVSVAILAHAEDIATQVGTLIALQIGRGTFFPLFELFLAKRVPDEIRTTTYAIISTISKATCFAFPSLVYLMSADLPDGTHLIRLVWMGTSSAMIISVLVLWLLRPKNGQK